MAARKNSKGPNKEGDIAYQGLLSPDEALDDDGDDLDLPPAARRAPGVAASLDRRGEPVRTVSAPNGGIPLQQEPEAPALGAGIRSFLAATAATADDPASWFRQIDEGFIKPTLLLDPGDGRGHGSDAV